MAQLVIVALALMLGADSSARGPQATERRSAAKFENELASVKVGSKVEDLQKRFPSLYRHRLAMGETLYEACDQKHLIVFNFTAEPWSPESVTYVDVRREDDVTVCRDATGALPDLGLVATTPRGVSIGAGVDLVLAKYGKPDEEATGRGGDRVLRYRSAGAEFHPAIRNALLVFMVRDGHVRSFSLSGDMPGAKTPWSKP